MPGMDGLETARHLARMPEPPAVIFTTAFEEHALAAFDARASGYLLKPVRAEKLQEALTRARQPTRAQLTRIAEGTGGSRTRIAVRVRDELRLIPVENVLCFIAEQKYTTMRHTGGDELIEEPLKELEDEFGARFVRVHRNCLVAVAHVESLERAPEGHQVVRLRGGAGTLAVSRRLATEVAKRLRA
jgi:two-component system response regulator AlgR